MGSATREALASAKKALDALGGKDGLALGEQLFEASRVIDGSSQLRSALADPAVPAAEKSQVVDQIFTKLKPAARSLLSEIIASRWSTPDDLLEGIEEVGIRAIAGDAKNGVIENELFAFGTAVSSNAELELAVGSKLGSPAAKSSLVHSLLAKKASKHTLAIVDHLVQQPRGRRINELMRHAADIVADQAGLSIATVVTARPISAAQLDRLRAGLAKAYGRDLQVNQVIDPSIIGGLRVQIGDDVIDGSVSTKLTELRLQLAS